MNKNIKQKAIQIANAIRRRKGKKEITQIQVSKDQYICVGKDGTVYNGDADGTKHIISIEYNLTKQA